MVKKYFPPVADNTLSPNSKSLVTYAFTVAKSASHTLVL